MANVRSKIALTEEEIAAYLDEQKTLIMGTLNHDGWPHLVPMWFVMIDGLVHMHTYKTSQKTVNIERDARGSVLVEDGEEYNRLRGVFIRGRFEVIDDQELCFRIGMRNAKKYMGVTNEDEAAEFIRASVRKRIALVFHPEKTSSWFHAKMT
jgi:PPOX class probable F420-dependent enzyme